MDAYNLAREKSVAPIDVPQILSASGGYALPFGPGRRWLSTGLPGKIIGGWTLTGIQSYRSGNALQITTGGLRTDAIFNGTIRPDLITGVPMVVDQGGPVAFGTGTQYLSPAAFAQVPKTANNVPLRLGTVGRYLPNVRGLRQVAENFGIMKRFAFTENKAVEIRGDFSNAFNRAGRGDPVTDITNPLFGKITGPAYGPRTIQLEARVSF